MAITQYGGDTNYVSLLPDKPVTDGGLTSAQFKSKFDQFGTEFKAWFNNTFVPAVNSAFNTHTHTKSQITDFAHYHTESEITDLDIPAKSTATPQPLGTAAAGSSDDFSPADHVHAMPSATDIGLNANQIRAIKLGTTVPTTSDISDGEIYLQYDE